MSEREREEARRKRLGLRPDESEIDRSALAIAVLQNDGLTLERHECLLIARLLAPNLVEIITRKKKGRGKPVSNATPVKSDQIAEDYFVLKALYPHRKHKASLASDVGKRFGVSVSYVDQVLGNIDPTRRSELEIFARSVAASFADWKAKPQIESMEAARQADFKQALLESEKKVAQLIGLISGPDIAPSARKVG